MNYCNANGQCTRSTSCPAGTVQDEIIARISRDVARQLAELEPRPRWRDELHYWLSVLAVVLALYGAIWLTSVLVT